VRVRRFGRCSSCEHPEAGGGRAHASDGRFRVQTCWNRAELSTKPPPF
jgi:hypothetical protein